MRYAITDVTPVGPLVLRVTFDDGLSGEFDLTDLVAGGPMFAALKDEAFFRSVGIGANGRTIGWNLDRVGEELDLCPDTIRIAVEGNKVHAMAGNYKRRVEAAE
jgi:hypothetical protein